jgi:anti-sigma factor ChrR (cupin superfamily)
MELIDHHPSEEVLERYLFGSLPEPEVEQVEEHLLVCHSCIDAAEQLLAFVQSLRSSLGSSRKPRTRAAGRGAVLER